MLILDFPARYECSNLSNINKNVERFGSCLGFVPAIDPCVYVLLI